MATGRIYRAAVLSVAKHDYVARGMASHPRFELAVVADDPHVPDWLHERNQAFAQSQGIPYVRDVERALREFEVDCAIVSSEAERHIDLSIRAALAGKHVVQDKPVGTRKEDVQKLVETVERMGVRFLMWNRNGIPAVVSTAQAIHEGRLGRLTGIHVDFYFAKDAGPPKGSRRPGYPPLNWEAHQIAAHIDGSDGGLGKTPMGELAIEAIYPLGYVQMITSKAVRRVFARTASHFHQLYADNQVEDLATVTLEMEDDLVATLAVGRIGLASHPSGGEIKLRVVGEKGALVVREANPSVGIYYRDQPPKEPRERRVANENDFFLADNFAHAIDTAGATILDARASQTIFAITEAALESARTGTVIEVPSKV